MFIIADDCVAVARESLTAVIANKGALCRIVHQSSLRVPAGDEAISLLKSSNNREIASSLVSLASRNDGDFSSLRVFCEAKGKAISLTISNKEIASLLAYARASQ